MRINELLVTSLMRTRLYEMAYARSKIIDKIEEYQEVVALHLVEVLIFEDVYSSNGWMREITSWLRKSQIKGNKSKPKVTQREYMGIFFTEPLGTVEDVQVTIEEAVRSNPEYKIQNPDAREVHKRVFEILNDVTHDMANNKFDKIGDYLWAGTTR